MFPENRYSAALDGALPGFRWSIINSTWNQHVNYQSAFALIVALLFAVLVLRSFKARYISTFGQFSVGLESESGSESLLTSVTGPPTYPSLSTLLSSVSFITKPKRVLYNATTFGKIQRPVHFRLTGGSLYVVQGKKHILSLWKASSKSSSTALHTFTFSNWFAMPKKTLKRYAADNSGFGPQPHPDSKVEPHNRADRLSHLVFKESLTGPDASSICSRFALRLCERLSELDVSTDDWKHMPDLVEFFQIHMTPANLESLWGVHLTKNSTFCTDFWDFNRSLHYFSWHLPRWMIPKAYMCRDRLLSAMKKWQSPGTDCKTSPWDEDGYDAQYWGSRLMRKWQKVFLEMDDADEDGQASVNLTFSWAVNSNVVPSAFWAVLEIFRRPELLAQVRQRLPSISSTAQFLEHFSQPENRALICSNPLLQSIFAETLRLRVHVYVARRFVHNAVDLDGFILPKDKLCLVSSHPAHTHESAWNTADGKYPVDVFWPYRFIVKPPSADPNQAQSLSATETQKPLVFSLDGLDGQWIPFGGGPRGCPGQKLAKHHMLITMAAMVTLFDIEILAENVALQMDETKYGAGTLHPKGKAPFKMRRRFLK